jgi:hypothetical protein
LFTPISEPDQPLACPSIPTLLLSHEDADRLHLEMTSGILFSSTRQNFIHEANVFSFVSDALQYQLSQINHALQQDDAALLKSDTPRPSSWLPTAISDLVDDTLKPAAAHLVLSFLHFSNSLELFKLISFYFILTQAAAVDALAPDSAKQTAARLSQAAHLAQLTAGVAIDTATKAAESVLTQAATAVNQLEPSAMLLEAQRKASEAMGAMIETVSDPMHVATDMLEQAKRSRERMISLVDDLSHRALQAGHGAMEAMSLEKAQELAAATFEASTEMVKGMSLEKAQEMAVHALEVTLATAAARLPELIENSSAASNDTAPTRLIKLQPATSFLVHLGGTLDSLVHLQHGDSITVRFHDEESAIEANKVSHSSTASELLRPVPVYESSVQHEMSLIPSFGRWLPVYLRQFLWSWTRDLWWMEERDEFARAEKWRRWRLARWRRQTEALPASLAAELRDF